MRPRQLAKADAAALCELTIVSIGLSGSNGSQGPAGEQGPQGPEGKPGAVDGFDPTSVCVAVANEKLSIRDKILFWGDCRDLGIEGETFIFLYKKPG